VLLAVLLIVLVCLGSGLLTRSWVVAIGLTVAYAAFSGVVWLIQRDSDA
jgi:hypothetical protein